MNEWALMHRGRIVNVVTTSETREQVEDRHPTYTVADLHSLPTKTLEAYEFWHGRP